MANALRAFLWGASQYSVYVHDAKLGLHRDNILAVPALCIFSQLFWFAALHSRKAACHGIRQPPRVLQEHIKHGRCNKHARCGSNRCPAGRIRVRVVDATTRQTMTDKAEVVFVPCPDSEPIKIANAALQDLPARRFLVKATAPGYNNSTTSTAPSIFIMTISLWTKTAARRKKS